MHKQTIQLYVRLKDGRHFAEIGTSGKPIKLPEDGPIESISVVCGPAPCPKRDAEYEALKGE